MSCAWTALEWQRLKKRFTTCGGVYRIFNVGYIFETRVHWQLTYRTGASRHIFSIQGDAIVPHRDISFHRVQVSYLWIYCPFSAFSLWVWLRAYSYRIVNSRCFIYALFAALYWACNHRDYTMGGVWSFLSCISQIFWFLTVAGYVMRILPTDARFLSNSCAIIDRALVVLCNSSLSVYMLDNHTYNLHLMHIAIILLRYHRHSIATPLTYTWWH